MKRTLTLIITVLGIYGSLVAQNFNGQITYSIDYKGSGVEQFKAMLPDTYDFFFRDSDMMMRVNGGMAAAMMGDIIVFGKQSETYMVKHSEKKAYKMPVDDKDQAKTGEKADPKVEDTGETATIAGYECKKYKVTVTDEKGKSATQYLWVTDKIQVQKPKKTTSMGSASSMFVDKINGFPLKIEVTVDQAGMTFNMIMTASKVDVTKPGKELFSIPDSYQVSEFDPSSFGF